MPAKTNEREYRDFHLTVVSVPDDAEERMIVRGYASTFYEPYTLYECEEFVIREQVAPDAFENADLSDVIMQYDHQGRVFARNSNGTLTVTPDETGLAIEADLGGTTIGRQLYEEIKGGFTTKMSYGYTVDAESREKTKMDDGRDLILRTVDRVKKVFDVSAVSLPANNATNISVRNLSDGVIEEVQAERLEARNLALLKLNLEIAITEVM